MQATASPERQREARAGPPRILTERTLAAGTEVTCHTTKQREKAGTNLQANGLAQVADRQGIA